MEYQESSEKASIDATYRVFAPASRYSNYSKWLLLALWVDCLYMFPFRRDLRFEKNPPANSEDIQLQSLLNDLLLDLWSNDGNCDFLSYSLAKLHQLDQNDRLMINQPAEFQFVNSILLETGSNSPADKRMSPVRDAVSAVNALRNSSGHSATANFPQQLGISIKAGESGSAVLLKDWLHWNNPLDGLLAGWAGKSVWLVEDEGRCQMLLGGRGRMLAWELARQLDEVCGWMEVEPMKPVADREIWWVDVERRVEALPDPFDWILR